jgi:hypothetical protein
VEEAVNLIPHHLIIIPGGSCYGVGLERGGYETNLLGEELGQRVNDNNGWLEEYTMVMNQPLFNFITH